MTDEKKQTKSNVLAFKCTERTRFYVEFLSIVQGRNLSTILEKSLLETIKNENFKGKPLTEILKGVWHVHEADRFMMRAFKFPELLSFDDEKRLNLIKENGAFWEGQFKQKKINKKKWKGATWTWKTDSIENVNFKTLRMYWKTLKEIFPKEEEKENLPNWERLKSLDTVEDLKLLEQEPENYYQFPLGAFGADIYKKVEAK